MHCDSLFLYLKINTGCESSLELHFVLITPSFQWVVAGLKLSSSILKDSFQTLFFLSGGIHSFNNIEKRF